MSQTLLTNMHINLGLASHTHLCSMFHRLRKQFLSGHEQTPWASVYSKCLGWLQRDEGFPGACMVGLAAWDRTFGPVNTWG